MILLLKNLLFTLIMPGTVAVYVPLLIARSRIPASGLLLAVGLALLCLGGAIYAWCVWDFAAYGRGTPAPIAAPKKLIIRGLYRYTRNPMYVAVLTVILGWAVLFRAMALVVYALIVGACFHLFVILYEEPHLKKEFGREYHNYRARVRRWLPDLRRKGNC
ncbi:MAG: isoprenylcysteine carboxylmethyltransferase family protein [Deltaproteobacteria bacterium]|nr:isoprenylcysteine carboxylmethyltransferase family protein [Deltaproteobacteria bacterium]